ncbi:helix-turn-helix domain-containing protein [Streptomyces europaeiscabiei]|uniref:helix-turn-helix domain-containing protein n=1 Tax=Streptomyces europaeiscabiei TaxID=146819 RepID=UPI0029A70103|nr:helix-turn-helix transcriptional regulator [Streptomyces europaeiscabiei]MDX2768321.1 helix-turn-helix transcriptional regulator [Streptomyces europaeiscabiei]MDX3611963.1 helix-turn-helix transcriptional regulator [Streptomyces europaeiscabiei]
MNWSEGVAREASRAGDYGRVIELARRAARMTQRQLGDACGLSQPAVSRMEKRGVGDYNMTTLARAAGHLGIPPTFVGLADTGTAPAAPPEGLDPVQRRQFLAGALATAATPARQNPSPRFPDWGAEQADVLRVATSAYRRMDATVPARQLSDTVQGHMRLVRTVAAQALDQGSRARLAAVGSEVASLAGWLSWDMADAGSARTWYGAAIKAARRSGDRLLIAYQQGSLAQFEVEAGNAAQGLSLIRGARRQLGSERPAIAAAWLAALEAVAHATVGDERAADRALIASMNEVEQMQISSEEAPPWPWVFAFDQRKVAAARVTCGARLARPRWVLTSLDDATAALTSHHEKQRALLGLDVASGHMASGHLDTAFALATHALDTGLRLRSGRIVERARAFRRSYSSATPPTIVRDFDAKLHDAYL